MAFALPDWTDKMREIFRSGTTSQFVLYGNVSDLFPVQHKEMILYASLRDFLTESMFAPFDAVIQYDRGKGLKFTKGANFFQDFMKLLQTYQPENSDYATIKRTAQTDDLTFLPRDPKRSLELIDRFLRASLYSNKIFRNEHGGHLRVAVIIDYAEFVIPRGEPLYLSGDLGEVMLRILDWARDPMISNAFAATCLITENLYDLNDQFVTSPYVAKIKIPLPNSGEINDFLTTLMQEIPILKDISDFSIETLAAKLLGLSQVNVRNLVRVAWQNNKRLTGKYIADEKKSLIEKEAYDKLEFVESSFTLDNVAGHEEAKRWLRQDVQLLKMGRIQAMPMGYLITGRIGTGKTFLVECYAGEVGIPVVELKNFREKWVGSTESNLEKIFSLLHALGQVIVFVDEADQATGKRGGGDGDAGLSGRIYSMLAREMSDTRNRGKIIWIFATSRPDLLEVDLKRQGRLDVHIPLFPPQDEANKKQLLASMADKLKLKLDVSVLPEFPPDKEIGGNEMEGILIRAIRIYETGEKKPEITFESVVSSVIDDFRPSAHTERLVLMDFLAVKECTDVQFLPPKYRAMTIAQVNQCIHELKLSLGEP